MASERLRAKQDIIVNSADEAEPSELKILLDDAQSIQHELAKEGNRNKEAMRQMELTAKAAEQRTELGFIGKLTGGKDNAPVAIALVAVVCGIFLTFLCFHYAAYSAAPQTWTREGDAALAFTSAALSFIFGRGSKR
jgi:hypothetical protein